MQEQLITFETAKLAKEKGFDELVLYFYDKSKTIYNLEEVFNYSCEGGMYITEWYKKYNSNQGYVENVYSAPTQSLLQKWLREELGIFVNVTVYLYESPGNSYFIPTINFQRGHKLIYTDFSEVFINKQENKCWKETVKTTLEKGAYEEAFESGLLEALNLIPNTNKH